MCLLEKQVTQLVKKLPTLMEAGGSLLYSQEYATGLYHESNSISELKKADNPMHFNTLPQHIIWITINASLSAMPCTFSNLHTAFRTSNHPNFWTCNPKVYHRYHTINTHHWTLILITYFPMSNHLMLTLHFLPVFQMVLFTSIFPTKILCESFV